MFTASIPKSKQTDVMASFWSMLKELEADAYNTLSPLDIMQVEGYFRQWNDIIKSSAQPVWQIYAGQQGKTSEQFLQEKREASRGF